MRRENETAFERVGLPRELSQAQAAQEQAIQAGKTNRAELDAIEKLTADKGIKTRYIYNEKIASEGFISGDTMTVNLARANGEEDYAFLIAAHEAGHAMKAGDAQKFAKFQEAALRLAENDKELGAYASAMRELYAGEVKGLDEAALNEEVSLKLAQQIVMDQHKLLQAVGQDRGLIGSFLDFVRGLKNSIAIKLTNSKKAMLDEAERTLVNLLRGEAGSVEGKRYSIREDAQGKPYVEIDDDILAGVTDSKKIETVRQELRSRYPDGFNWRGWNVALDAKGIREFLRSRDTEKLRANQNQNAYNDKMRMAANLDEIIAIADNIRNESPAHARKDNLRSFNRADVRIRVGGNDYTAEVVTGIKPSTKEIFYDIVRIKPANIKDAPVSSEQSKTEPYGTNASLGSIVSQPEENTRGMNIKLPGPGGAQGNSSLTAPYRLPDGRSVREYIAQEYGKTSLPLFDKKDAAGAIKTDYVDGKPVSIGGATTSLDKIVPQSGENATGAEIELPDPQAMRWEKETAFERVALPRELSQAQVVQEQAIQAGKTNRAELNAIEKLTADKRFVCCLLAENGKKGDAFLLVSIFFPNAPFSSILCIMV